MSAHEECDIHVESGSTYIDIGLNILVILDLGQAPERLRLSESKLQF